MAGKPQYKASRTAHARQRVRRTDVEGTIIASTTGQKGNAPVTKVRRALEASVNGRGLKGTPGPGVVAMEITPEVAADWLAMNRGNRKMRDSRVIRLAKEIENGRWQDLNGETIKFAPDGELLDGQHRLAAVLVANKAITSYVAFGVEHEAFKTIDTGLKRSGADAMFVSGEDNVRSLSAICNAMFRYLSDGSFLNREAPSNAQLLATLQASPGLRESAELARSLKKRLAGLHAPVAGVMHYLMREVDAEDADYFFEQLKTGVGLDSTSPIYHLRERLIKQRLMVGTGKSNYREQQEQAVIIAKAWNGWRQDVPYTAKTLRFWDEEKLPELK